MSADPFTLSSLPLSSIYTPFSLRLGVCFYASVFHPRQFLFRLEPLRPPEGILFFPLHFPLLSFGPPRPSKTRGISRVPLHTVNISLKERPIVCLRLLYFSFLVVYPLGGAGTT